ncbi:Evi5-Like Protein [Manis pentadactyla]|nr:Evi5-Like Protein [Manis pentadactyla]
MSLTVMGAPRAAVRLVGVSSLEPLQPCLRHVSSQERTFPPAVQLQGPCLRPGQILPAFGGSESQGHLRTPDADWLVAGWCLDPSCQLVPREPPHPPDGRKIKQRRWQSRTQHQCRRCVHPGPLEELDGCRAETCQRFSLVAAGFVYQVQKPSRKHQRPHQ